MNYSLLKNILFTTLILAAKCVFSQNTIIFQTKNEQYGIKDNSGKVIVNPEYHNIYEFDLLDSRICDCGKLQYLCVIDNGKKKALYSTQKLKFISDFEYDTLYTIGTSADFGIAKEGKKIGLINLQTGKLIIPIEMDSIVYINHFVSEWGTMRDYFVDENIKPKYVRFIRNNQCELYQVNGKIVMTVPNEKDIVFIKDGQKVIAAKRSEIDSYINQKSEAKIIEEDINNYELFDRAQ